MSDPFVVTVTLDPHSREVERRLFAHLGNEVDLIVEDQPTRAFVVACRLDELSGRMIVELYFDQASALAIVQATLYRRGFRVPEES